MRDTRQEYHGEYRYVGEERDEATRFNLRNRMLHFARNRINARNTQRYLDIDVHRYIPAHIDTQSVRFSLRVATTRADITGVLHASAI